jgi:predicted metal-dependent HD superfamily phosphohydrolase
LATATHDPAGSDLETALLIAADLSVLAADPAGYADYARNVRREYGHVSDADWITGRSRVLRTFLDRASVFPAVLRLDEWERQARANITAELAMLNRGGSRDDEAVPEP